MVFRLGLPEIRKSVMLVWRVAGSVVFMFSDEVPPRRLTHSVTDNSIFCWVRPPIAERGHRSRGPSPHSGYCRGLPRPKLNQDNIPREAER